MKDNRSLLLVLLVLTFLLTLLTIFVVAEGGVPSVSARSSVLFEPITNTFVFENNANERRPMASTTKIMTALLAIENCNLDDRVTIPKEATGIEGSSIYLKVGDVISIRDLIYSVLLQSANDAATALAIEISGDEKSFADLMNARAKAIGLNDTCFENPHGLDSQNHYTTAHDLALLASEALKNNTFKEICSTKKYTFSISDSQRTIFNHNKLLKLFDGATGVKTGYTDKSGRCLVSSALRNGITLICVTLNAPDDWNDHSKLLEAGYDEFECVAISEIAPIEFRIPVENGTEGFIVASVNYSDLLIPHLKSDAPLHAEVNIKQTVTAPVKKDDIVGTVSIYCGDKFITEYNVTATNSINANKHKIKFSDFFKITFME